MLKKITKKKLFLLIPPLLLLLWFLAWSFGIIEDILDRSYSITLTEDKWIAGKQYYEGDFLYLDSPGKVSEVTRWLKEDTVIQGVEIPKGSKLCLYESDEDSSHWVELFGEMELQGPSYWVELSEETEVQGTTFPKGTSLHYESGKLATVDLSQDSEVQGIKCAARGATILFNLSGELIGATLAKAQEIQGVILPKRARFQFDESGKLWLADLPMKCEVNGVKCDRGEVNFHKSGKLENVTLSEDQEIQKVKCCKGDEVYFDENGNITAFERSLKDDMVIQGIKLSKGARVSFYSSGKLKYIFSSQNQKIQEIRFPKWSAIYFYESGELKAATLPRRWKVRGKRYHPGKILIFDENGNVSSVREIKKPFLLACQCNKDTFIL